MEATGPGSEEEKEKEPLPPTTQAASEDPMEVDEEGDNGSDEKGETAAESGGGAEEEERGSPGPKGKGVERALSSSSNGSKEMMPPPPPVPATSAASDAAASDVAASKSSSGSSSILTSKYMSPYQIFQKSVAGQIRKELEEKAAAAAAAAAAGAAAPVQIDHHSSSVGIGEIQGIISTRWKALSDEERAPYIAESEELKREHEKASLEADRLAEEEQARRRMERDVSGEVTGPRKAAERAKDLTEPPKKPAREMSEEEKERRRLAKEETVKRREEAEREIAGEKGKIEKAVAEKAEARLNYLLQQSDIFTHFGAGKNMAAEKERLRKEREAREAKEGGGSSSSSNKRRGSGPLEEDEEDADESSEAGGTFLTQQPSAISGGKLRHYQLEGLNWMIRLSENGINGILADEMGLGKTLQSISILAYQYEALDIHGPHLIMVPKSTLSNWINEVKRWCPSLRPLRFHGSKEERAEMIAEFLRPVPHEQRSWDVCVTTYEIANMERMTLQKIAWRYLIIDEAHRLKNEASVFSQNVRALKSEHRLLLTGTPLQNNLHELWALLNFLLPDVFSSAEQFDEWFNLDISDVEAKQRMISQLHKILRPFMLRRLKADVEKSLPPKTETILFVGLSAQQKEVYRNILLRDIDAVNGTGQGGGAGKSTILNIVMQLRKCCNHPYLFAGVEDRTLDPLGEHLIQNCGKMVLLDKLLTALKQRGHRVLVFSQMTRMLDILEDYCHMRGMTYCRIDGNTSYEAREDQIAAYNAPDSELFLFMLSTRAGGLGINLQTADTVILYDSDWNPQADLQAMDRAHRIGQKRPVSVYRLVTENTVEEKVVERAQQKLKMDAMVVQQGRLSNAAGNKVTKEDMLEALRFGADTVFRSKESAIRDEDIDAILAAGEERTKAMEQQVLTAADKGDLLDFKLDGGLSSQQWDGVDYSKAAAAGGLQGSGLDSKNIIPYFIDTGKRERKKVASYKEDAFYGGVSRPSGPQEKKKKQLPMHLRLPKMEDFQFYNRERLLEIHEQEETLFQESLEKGTFEKGTQFSVLPDDLAEEKKLLLDEGFADWSRQHFLLFVRASAKYGRDALSKIAVEVGKSAESVQAYSKAFWLLASTKLSAGEWDKILKNIEKGEKKLEEISRLSEATAAFVKRFKNPWEQLTFGGLGQSHGKNFNSTEDRHLLCLAHQYGYGAWDEVKAAIRRSDRFRFDYYLRSCSADLIGKRCEALMKQADKENTEWLKREQTTAAVTNKTVGSLVLGERTLTEEEVLQKQQMAEFGDRLREEAKQLDELRKERANLILLANTSKEDFENLENDFLKKTGGGGSSSSHKKKKQRRESADTEGGGAPANLGGGRLRSVPDSLLPALAKCIVKWSKIGVNNLVNKFVQDHDEVSKRQVEFNIHKLAYKEKKAGNSREEWYIRDEFLHMLEQGDGEGKGEDKGAEEGEEKKARNPYSFFKEAYRDAAKLALKKSGISDPHPDQVKNELKKIWNNQLSEQEFQKFEEIAIKNGYNKITK